MGHQEGRLSTAHSGRLLLVRHGETEWSRDKLHTGRTDIALTALGEQQARELADVLSSVRPVLALSSPRARAVRTAELAGLAGVVLDDDLVEWDYGEYEGRTTAEIRQNRPGWTIWTGNPPGGETAEQVAVRADRVLRRIEAVLPEGDVVIVGHGHHLRMLTTRWLDLAPSAGQGFSLDTATVGVLGFEHDHHAVRRWNLPAAAAAGAL